MASYYTYFLQRNKIDGEKQYDGLNYDLEQIIIDLTLHWWKGFIIYGVILSISVLLALGIDSQTQILVLIAIATFCLICSINSAAKLIAFCLMDVSRNTRKFRIRSIKLYNVDGSGNQLNGVIEDYRTNESHEGT